MVKFGELENLEIIGREGSDSVQVEVNPGHNEIVVLNRKDRGCSFNWTYYTSIVKEEEELLKNIKNTGKKNQIEYEGKKFDIFYYVLKNGNGYLWYFENETQTSTFDATFYFKLENLEIKREEDKNKERPPNECRVRIKPQEWMVLRLTVIDITKSWGYKYSYSFKLKEDIKNNEEQMMKIRSKGERKQLDYKGMDKTKESFDFYIYFQAEKYYWLFENKTKRRFKGTFSFSLKNLSIEVDEEDENKKQDDKQDIDKKKSKESKKKIKDKKTKKNKNTKEVKEDEKILENVKKGKAWLIIK